MKRYTMMKVVIGILAMLFVGGAEYGFGEIHLTPEDILTFLEYNESYIQDIKISYTTHCINSPILLERYKDVFLEKFGTYAQAHYKGGYKPPKAMISEYTNRYLWAVKDEKKYLEMLSMKTDIDPSLKRHWKQVLSRGKVKTYDYPSNSGIVASKWVNSAELTPDMLGLVIKGMLLSKYLRQGQLSLSKISEMIDGHKCYVLTSIISQGSIQTGGPLQNITKIWVDLERGGWPLRIETGQKNKTVKINLYPQIVVDLIRLQKIKPDFWFPVEGRCQQYDMNFKISSRGNSGISIDHLKNGKMGIQVSKHLTVESIEINSNLPDDFFDISYPNGTLIYDKLINVGYTLGSVE